MKPPVIETKVVPHVILAFKEKRLRNIIITELHELKPRPLPTACHALGAALLKGNPMYNVFLNSPKAKLASKLCNLQC
jgi:hypothetical protein